MGKNTGKPLSLEEAKDAGRTVLKQELKDACNKLKNKPDEYKRIKEYLAPYANGYFALQSIKEMDEFARGALSNVNDVVVVGGDGLPDRNASILASRFDFSEQQGKNIPPLSVLTQKVFQDCVIKTHDAVCSALRIPNTLTKSRPAAGGKY